MTFKSLSELSRLDPDRIYMFTVGGCGEFGMNLTIYATKGHCYVVDAGLAFAETFEIGIDARIPDIDQLEKIIGKKPTAYLITHGHEDHIGALPYFLKRWPAPVYIGPWAQALVSEKLRQLKDGYEYKFHEVKAGMTTKHPGLNVRWVHVPHSIPHCSSIMLEAGPHRVFHTGDFKVNGFTPYEPSLDLAALKRLAGEAPVLAVVSDSTNAHAAGHCPSEHTVTPTFTELLGRAEGISFVTTFSSNFWRLKTVLQIAKQLNKRVLVFGAGMRRSLEIAEKTGLLGDEKTAIIEEEASRRVDRKDLVILCSGCQGEHKSGLKRIVHNEVHSIKAKEGDQVIFSSRAIPGNEKSIAKIMSRCAELGVATLTARDHPGIHVSGHAYSEDLKAVLEAVQPRYSIPVHGTFNQLEANRQLTDRASVQVSNGQITALSADKAETVAAFDLHLTFLDSWNRLPMSYDTMRERHKIGDSGMALLTGYVKAGRLTLDVDFVGMPFDSDQDKNKMANRLTSDLVNILRNLERGHDLNEKNFNERARLSVRRTLSDRFIKKPVVISKVMLIGS